MFYKLKKLLEAKFSATRTLSGASKAWMKIEREKRATPYLNKRINLVQKRNKIEPVIPMSPERNKIRGLPQTPQNVAFKNKKIKKGLERSHRKYLKKIANDPEETKKYLDYIRQQQDKNKDK